MDKNKTSSGTAPQPAPTPRVEKEMQALRNNLKTNPNHVAGKKG